MPLRDDGTVAVCRTTASIRSSSCPLTRRKSRRPRGRARTPRASPRRGACTSGRRIRRRTSSRRVEPLGGLGDALVHLAEERFGPRDLLSFAAVHRCSRSPDAVEERQRGTSCFGCARPVRFPSCARAGPSPSSGSPRFCGPQVRRRDSKSSKSGTATAEDAARAAGCPIGQIVKSIVVLCDGRPVVVLVPGDRRVDLAKIARAAGAAEARIARGAEVEEATGFAPGAVAPFPLPNVDRVADRPEPARPRHGLGRRRLRHAHGCHEPGRPRPARPRAADGRRPRLDIRFRPERRRLMHETETIWMNGEFVDWADAKVHVGVHGLHYGTGVFEGIRCYETPDGPAVFRLKEHLQRLAELGPAALHGAAVHGRRAPHRHARADRPQRAARVLHPPVRVLRLRRARRAHEGQPGRGRDHELAVGELPRRRERQRSASAPRSRPGSASARTRSRTRPRRPGSTSTRCSPSTRRSAPATTRRSCSTTRGTSPTGRARTSSSSRTAGS